MSVCFSFSYFSCRYLFILIVVSLFHLCLSNKSFDGYALCMGSEREDLLRFKHGLIDEAGRLASWDDGEESNCCKWAGIGCDNITGHVRRINLRALDGHCQYHDTTEAPKQRLRGKLSSSLLHLKQLRHLDLSCNDFGGIQVPEFVGSLGNLRYLNLSGSNFSGMIPLQLGNLSCIQVLCLGSFHSPWEQTSISNMQWLSSLHLLQHLDLSGVNLNKALDWLQVINTIPSLVQLHMSECELSNIYPHIASLNLTSMSVLDLSQNDFSSSFPRWMFSITSLVSLDLSDTGFHGVIPRSMYSFCNLTSLMFLHVSSNDFRNSSLVLDGLSNCIGSNLVSLDLSSSHVSSSVLSSLYNLSSLLSLDLSQNQLTKEIPKSLGNLCNLNDLDLSSNNFVNISLTRLLESVLKCNSPHLKSLILSNSELSGTIPDSVGRLSFLSYLDLGMNLISGAIPYSIGGLSSLEELYLSHNQLDGSLPDSIGQLSSLEILDLSYNSIHGTIPDSIGRLSFVRSLDLFGNQISGPIPYSIGQLSSLEALHLSLNQLNGGLPNSLGQLSNLEKLDISSNKMTGVVTEAHFSKLVKLKYLDGKGNNLIVRLRHSNWIPPFQLSDLCLNSWGLGPRFPLWLQSQKDLEKLEISNTRISSPMPPDSFWRSLPNLIYLDMSQNHIQGTLLSIPATVELLDLSSNELTGELTHISKFPFPPFLDLSNNFFNGSLHDLLCANGVKQTSALYLGNNQLSGVIPECWDMWPILSTLNLENNNLSGGIPRSMGSSYNLQSIEMHGNKLSGRLPASLMNMTSLEILQLGRNELVGSIPSWFGTNLSNLRLLNLRSNSFNGHIPPELCYLKYIQILDIADNNLSGNIPRCFYNFSVLSGKETTSGNQFVYYPGYIKKQVSDSLVMKGQAYTYKNTLKLLMLLDLSNNNISGNIPSELTLLLKLQTLNLSRNHLTGRIPENIGNMKSLESFDLSLNKLLGELPMSLSRLNSLSNFNVSFNSLTGNVPSSTQLQSFNESSFFGNKLCGDPLTNPCVSVEVPKKTETHQEEDDGSHVVDWGFIISMIFGFTVGFWIVVAPLIFSRPRRIAYFRFLSKVRYIVYDGIHKCGLNMFPKQM